MKSGRLARSAVLLLLGLSAVAAAPAPKLKSVTIAIRNRIFHDFADQQAVVQGKSFIIGDTDYSARIVQYVPDFAMDLSTGKVVSRSQEPKNPAFKLIVSRKGKPQDTTWAMMSLPPHFTRRSFLAFKVMRIDFVGRQPIVVDSVQAYKELEALKEQARKNAKPTEAEPNPHGMGLNPHAAGGPLPHGGATGANPHGGAAGMSPHGGASPHGTSPHGGSSIPIIPSHGSGGGKTQDAK